MAMGSRWLFQNVEESIASGNWLVSLGLLEDIFRCADGMEPRKVKQIGPEVPYLGKYAAFWRNDIKRNGPNPSFSEENVSVVVGGPQEGKVKVEGRESAYKQAKSDACNDLIPMYSTERCLQQRTPDDDIVPTDLRRSGGLGFARYVLSDKENTGPAGDGNDLTCWAQKHTVPDPKGYTIPDSKGYTEGRQSLKAAREVEEKEDEDEDEDEDEEKGEGEGEGEEEREEEQAYEATKRAVKDRACAANSCFPEPTKEDVFILTRWLMGKLRVKLNNADALCTHPFISEEFKSGNLLVRIAEALNPGRATDIAGVQRNPKTRAGKLGNCRRAVEALISQFRPSAAAAQLSVKLRSSYDLCCEGDAKAIVALLLKVRALHGGGH